MRPLIIFRRQIAGPSSIRPWARRSLVRNFALNRLQAVLFFLAAASSGFSAVIIWGTPTTISGDADVSTAGVGNYAYFEGGAGANLSINGVTFTNEGGITNWGNVTFSGSGTFTYATNGLGNNVVPFAGLSANYSNVLSGGIWIKGGGPVTVTLNNLTPGHQYLVQFWANDSRFPGVQTNRYETLSGIWGGGNLFFNSTHVAGGVGQYVIGTFVADTTNQSFIVTGGNLTSGGSVDAQTEAIQVRDNGVYVYTPIRINLAKYQPVITDSTNGTQSAAYLTEGFVDDDSGWVSDSSGPHWAAVTFPFPVTVGSAQLVMGQKSALPLTVFYFQYLTNGNWVTVPGSTVVSNTNLERNIVFSSPITASSFRVYDSLDSPIHLRQLALYPPNGTNGFPFGTDFSLDLARKQPAFATANTAGNWPLLAADGLISSSSAWETTLAGSNSLLINLQFTNKIGSAHLYSGTAGVPPMASFILQYWTGSAWGNIPGGSIAGNTNSALVIPFTTPVTTTKVQLVFTNTGISAVQELCIFPANSNGGYPLGTGVVSNTPVTAKYDTYSDSYYYLSNSTAGAVIVESNGAPVLGMAAGTNLAAQYQVLLNYDNGTYRLINRATGLCLAGAHLTTNTGALVLEETYMALPDQDWFLQPLDGISFYLVNQYSGLVLDMQGGALVQNVQANCASQLWQISLAQIFPKKGIAGSWGGYPIMFDANWTYGWWYGPNPNLAGINYYPMDPDTWYRGSTVAGNLWTLQPGWRTAGYSLNIMGYNEPDMVGQADIDATNGAIYWMNDQNLDLPLAGPAAGNVNGAWNQIFYGYITNWGCRVDYLPAHEYPGNNSSASSGIWINTLQTAFNTYGIPMWMTEFGVVDWGGTGNWSEEDNYNALAEFLWRAESVPWLRKYSLFIFHADTNSPMAINPWTRITPAPRSNAYDTKGNFTPLGELYAAWDDDSNVETNKIYYIHNSDTRKRLQNTLASTVNATDIRVNDFSTKWMLVPASSNLYYIVSSLDGRRLSFTNGGFVNLSSSNAMSVAVQWSLTPNQYGWFYLDHPATGLRLQMAFNNTTSVATFTMAANTTTTTAVHWRFIATLPPPVWTGFNNNFWSTPGNWTSVQSPMTGQSATFNYLSTANLNTVLDTNYSLASVIVTTPAAAVSISGTNTLSLGSGIDLAAANQNLTINVPVIMSGGQNWNVSSGCAVMVNSGISGGAALAVMGGGGVWLNGTNTYSGSTTLNASALTIGGAGLLGGGNYASAMTNNGAFNYNSSASQIVSGTISGNGSLMVNGIGTLMLSGTNTYTGSTSISAGTLALNGNGSLASTKIVVGGGAVFNISGTAKTFALGSLVTLTNSSFGAVLNGTNNCSVGTLSLLTDGTNAAFIQTNGTMTFSASTVIKVNNIGVSLTAGLHPLVMAVPAGNIGKVTGVLPAVTVTGNGATGGVALQTNGTGGLDLVVANPIAGSPPNINYRVGNGMITLVWPGDHLGWIAQSNSLDLLKSNNWFDILGSQATTNLNISIRPGTSKVFYRLRYPF